jgi:preprotein translocase subunit SecF
MQIFKNPNFDFLRWRWHALVVSAVVIAAGLGLVATRGLPLGIDFSGGTSLIIEFSEEVSLDRVRDAVASLPGDEVIQRYGEPEQNQVLIRLAQEEGAEEGASLEQGSLAAEQALRDAGLPTFEVVNRRLVGPTIGADLQRRGIYATLTSLAAITVYIGFRFRFTFAIGALVAVFHDVLVTGAFLLLAGYDISLNVVAGILTITGYSVNDTIVVFDRVRENLRSRRREALDHVINVSVNQTLGRTVITSGTTILALLALYLYGGEALEGFSFTMLVGVISGTYSTVFIASAVAIILSQRRARSAAAPAAAGEAASRQGRKPGKARAS